ncbi:hypothetical protein FT641_18345 [Bacillus paranthracis]|uniref:DUF4429 domain-containing protein n=1 Tax=Bacillus paranthracis TaxID=2026186 RepID=UPI001879E011|nr:DUF4429 domain-containing protein [Bacillus paranthracis]MBE7114476.1 hypothetical protein [Bacillus paranthracis]MBE7154650.1 hypothetical protein [Bacillus paranthracis]
MVKVYEFKGARKTRVELDGTTLRIQRVGFMSSLDYWFNGDVTFDVLDLIDMEIKEPGFSNGFIYFILPGSYSSFGGSLLIALNDKNAVIFTDDEYDMVQELKKNIEDLRALEDKRKREEVKVRVDDEIERCEWLLAKGRISCEEFAEKKKTLLEYRRINA